MTARLFLTVRVYDSGPVFFLSRASSTSPASAPVRPAYSSLSSPASSLPSSARPSFLTTTRPPAAGRQPGPRAAVCSRTAGMVRGALERGYVRVGEGLAAGDTPAVTAFDRSPAPAGCPSPPGQTATATATVP